MRGRAAPGSLGPAALLGVSGARNPLPTGSPSWASRIERAKSFCALGPAMPPEPARPLSVRPPRTKGPKGASGSCILQRETLLGSKPQPLRASAQESSASLFRPRPCALHRAQLSWATPGSLGPAALLGVSCTRITLHTGSPSWGSRIGSAKAVCAQAPAMPPEPARQLSAEVLSQRRPKTSFLELHPAKGNSHWAANHSPNAPPLRKAAQAFFALGPALSLGRCGGGLPLAPWALLLCSGSPAPETHSQRVLLRGEAGLGARRTSAPWAQPCPLSQLGRSAPRPRRTEGPKRASGSCILQRETLLGQQTTTPRRLGSGKQRKPFLPLALRSP